MRKTLRSGHLAFTLIELMIVVAIIAILAMVAIPAFVKYIRRSKTTEATMNIRKLYDSSVAYYLTERASRSVVGYGQGPPEPGGIVPRQFPQFNVFEPTEGLTPPYFYQEIIGQFGMVPGLGAGGGGYDPKVAWAFGESGFKCCKQPGGKCPSWLWNGAWTALNFAIDDPFYFHYMYTSSGTEREATFTASAFGDLDCDDEWSTYERTGSVDSAWHPVGGGGLYVNNDIE